MPATSDSIMKEVSLFLEAHGDSIYLASFSHIASLPAIVLPALVAPTCTTLRFELVKYWPPPAAWQTDVLLDDSMYAAMVDVRVPTRNYACGFHVSVILQQFAVLSLLRLQSAVAPGKV